MLQGRPLLATAPDARLFVGREEELGQLARSVSHGLNVALYGDRGVGKSSLLHQLEYVEREGRRVVYVDGSGVDDVTVLVERLRLSVGGRTGVIQDAIKQEFRVPIPSSVLELPGVASTMLVDGVRSLDQAQATLVLIDASGSPEATYELFGRLRDELWQLKHRWIVAVDARDWPHLQRPPADAFFDITINVPPLDESALLELLSRRKSGLKKADLARIASASDGNPRRALELVRQAVIGQRPIAEILMARAMREQAAARLGRPHSMLLAELEASSEPLSPSDDQLLERMGWTRERAGQVFRELEDGGIVGVVQDRQARGRPRKLYFPNQRYRPTEIVTSEAIERELNDMVEVAATDLLSNDEPLTETAVEDWAVNVENTIRTRCGPSWAARFRAEGRGLAPRDELNTKVHFIHDDLVAKVRGGWFSGPQAAASEAIERELNDMVEVAATDLLSNDEPLTETAVEDWAVNVENTIRTRCGPSWAARFRAEGRGLPPRDELNTKVHFIHDDLVAKVRGGWFSSESRLDASSR